MLRIHPIQIRQAIYKGLAELVQSEIIARGPNEYNWFINPLIVFNGDRVSFTKTYVRKKDFSCPKRKKKQRNDSYHLVLMNCNTPLSEAAVWSLPFGGGGG